MLELNDDESEKYEDVKLLYDDVNTNDNESYPSNNSEFEDILDVDANDALNTDIDDVWFVKITGLPFKANDPVIVNEPVNWC
jgi:hypothetical protein